MANGFFLGGFAEGAKTAEDIEAKKGELAIHAGTLDLGKQKLAADTASKTRGLDLQEKGLGQQFSLQTRALNIQEQARRDAVSRQTITQVSSLLSENMQFISESIKAAKSAGWENYRIDKRISPFIQDITRIATKAGIDPQSYIKQIEIMIDTPTGTELAVGGAESKIAAAKAVQAATGIEQKEALVGQGIIKQSQKDPAIASKRDILLKSGLDKPAEALSPDEMAAGIAGGRFVVSINPQTNERQVMDIATGKTVGKQQVVEAIAEPEQSEQPTLDVSGAIGIEGAVKNAVNTLADIVRPGKAPFKSSLESEAALNTL